MFFMSYYDITWQDQDIVEKSLGPEYDSAGKMKRKSKKSESLKFKEHLS